MTNLSEEKKEFFEKFSEVYRGYSESDQMVAVMQNKRIKDSLLRPIWRWIQSLVDKKVGEERTRIKNAIISITRTETQDPDSAGIVYIDDLFDEIGGIDNIYDQMRHHSPVANPSQMQDLEEKTYIVDPEDLPF